MGCRQSTVKTAAAYDPGLPVGSYMPPGKCAFGADWEAVPLISKASISPETWIFTFKLPDPKKPLGLSTCACLLMKGVNGPWEHNGSPVIRPYTPVSTNQMLGQFILMVKIYKAGKMTQHLDQLSVGARVQFKHVEQNVKVQYPFRPHVGMIVGGTGITPMIQALHCILGTEGDTTQVALLYGSKASDQILAKETLDKWEESNPSRLHVTHVLSYEPEGSGWTGARGYITKELIKEKMPPASSDCVIFVCGPPSMYNLLCGPRDQPELTGVLAGLGYKTEQVYKF